MTNKNKVLALEIYDSFNPDRLLEVRFATKIDDRTHYDWSVHDFGTSYTGRTFRSSYASLREFMMKKDWNYEIKEEVIELNDLKWQLEDSVA